MGLCFFTSTRAGIVTPTLVLTKFPQTQTDVVLAGPL